MLNGLRHRLQAAYGRHLRERVKSWTRRWIAFAGRVQPASSLHADAGLSVFVSERGYRPIDVHEPEFRVRRPDQTALLRSFLANPNLRAFNPSVVRAEGVHVSAPEMVHRWHGVSFLEGLLGDPENLSYPRLVIDFELMPLRRSRAWPEGILLALPLYSNYYHWMVELLPRLQLLDDHPAWSHLPLIVPASLPPFALETLRLAGLTDRVVFLPNGLHRFDSLVVPSILSPPSHPSPRAVDWLRTRLGKPMLPADRRRRRLYVSRRDAAARFACNETEVEAMLGRFGFETVVMSGLSVEQQIALFASAEVIVGIHGASLTNLAFTESGACVIELFQEAWFTNAFYHLATIRGHHYGYLVCPRQGAGLVVPVDLLETLILQVLTMTSAMPRA